MMTKNVVKRVVLLLILLNTCCVFAQNASDNTENENILIQAAKEVDKIFGRQLDEYTLCVGADFIHDKTDNKFVYYYIVAPEIWDDFLEATQEMKEVLKDGLKESLKSDKNFELFLKILIENNTELHYNYGCKNEYITIVFSVDELKKI